MPEMGKFKSGAIREDKTGKGRCDLLPMCSLERLSKYFEKCLDQHPERNWEKGIPMHSFLDSGIRHLFKYMDGQTDEDHLCAAAWNILCAMWTEEKHPEMQDIPSREVTCGPPETGDSTEHVTNCRYWRSAGYGVYKCWGTRECKTCKCGGDTSKCDFYPEKYNAKQ